MSWVYGGEEGGVEGVHCGCVGGCCDGVEGLGDQREGDVVVATGDPGEGFEGAEDVEDFEAAEEEHSVVLGSCCCCGGGGGGGGLGEAGLGEA